MSVLSVPEQFGSLLDLILIVSPPDLVLLVSLPGPVVLVVLALLAGGVIVTVTSEFPGSMLSLAGVYFYWYHTGFTEPSSVLVALLTVVGFLSLAGSLFGTVIAGHLPGASTTSVLVAGAAGLVTFALAGPGTGLLVVLAVVFVLEYRRNRRLGPAMAAVFAVTVGSVASKIVRVLLTGSMLAVMLAVTVL